VIPPAEAEEREREKVMLKESHPSIHPGINNEDFSLYLSLLHSTSGGIRDRKKR